MKVDKSPDPDQVYPKALQKAREEIVEVLTEMYELPFDTVEVPKDWRVANVLPQFKEGCKVKPGNYKAVSLTSVVEKLMEYILRNQIYMHLEGQRLIWDGQHSFVYGRQMFFEEVTKKADEG